MTTIAEMTSLKGRVSLVTGAGGHLGRVICQTLAEMGSALVLVDRPGTEVDGLAAALKERWKTDVDVLYSDLEIQDERTRLMADVRGRYPRLSVLVNNAAFVGTSGLTGWAERFSNQSVETWRRALEVNLTSVFDLCKGLADVLREGPSPCIINVASIYGLVGPDWSLYEGTSMANPAAYAASKGGLIQLTRWLATTMAPVVRVNAVSPAASHRVSWRSTRRGRPWGGWPSRMTSAAPSSCWARTSGDTSPGTIW